MRCWMAPRDVVPGQEWRAAITEAILGCRVFVLIFSGNANASADVRREVGIAFDREKEIVPLRTWASS